MASTEDIETNTLFAQKNNAKFPILSDPDKETAIAYGLLGDHGYANRWTIYISAEGVILKIDKKVKPLTAGADIVSNLEALKIPLK